jgi:hypothetical protein
MIDVVFLYALYSRKPYEKFLIRFLDFRIFQVHGDSQTIINYCSGYVVKSMKTFFSLLFEKVVYALIFELQMNEIMSNAPEKKKNNATV